MSSSSGRAMSDSPRKRGINEASPRRNRNYNKPPVPSKKKVKMQVSWPPNVLPCELYDLIICHLPRESIQNMRLVNHEFEQKVSEYLFKRVVVPFKPELYSISQVSLFSQVGPEKNADSPPGAVLLQDKGMRVFQGFGSHIRQFALSFEFDEALLTRPPIKTDQEAVTTFWGIYRWPFKEYNRYRQLEGLEQTADETRTMANALRYITNAKEIGLSIDGGLGWLSGPDTREKPAGKPTVFGGPRYIPVEEPKKQPKVLMTPNNSFSDLWGDEESGNVAPTQERENQREALLMRMLRESGYEGNSLARSLRTLAESEGPAPAHPLQNDLTEADPVRNEAIENALRASGYAGAVLNNMRTLLNQREYRLNDRPDQQRLADLEYDVRELGRTAMSMRAQNFNFSDHNSVPLKPNDLSNAQKEMLLEIEWAQRAFMQSWAIAIIDNVETFHGIETLTIARLPSRHLPIIKRDDFWSSFPSLRKVSLAIIPDWREVVKLPTSFVQDIKLEPSRAVGLVYDLIKEHVAPRENIKSLHFEWLCGGEDAPGLFARNKNILAAPFLHKPLDMVNTVSQPAILNLPHVEHLSIKNCWFSPHVLMRFANDHRDTLQSLTLNSVSLCAPPARNAQPAPAHNHAALFHMQPHGHGVLGNIANGAAAAQPMNFLNAFAAPMFANNGGNANNAGQVYWQQAANNPPFQLHGNAGPPPPLPPPQFHWNGNLAQAPPPPLVPVQAAPSTTLPSNSWRRDPREGSWAYIIDQLTPGDTIAMQRYDPDRDYDLPPLRRHQKLKTIEFISCGYIHLPLDFDQSIIQPSNPPQENAVINKRRSDIESYMMKPLDASMGTIVNFIGAVEKLQLEHAFGMQIGWEGDGVKAREERAEADGVVVPGQGRFGGVVSGAGL